MKALFVFLALLSVARPDSLFFKTYSFNPEKIIDRLSTEASDNAFCGSFRKVIMVHSKPFADPFLSGNKHPFPAKIAAHFIANSVADQTKVKIDDTKPVVAKDSGFTTECHKLFSVPRDNFCHLLQKDIFQGNGINNNQIDLSQYIQTAPSRTEITNLIANDLKDRLSTWSKGKENLPWEVPPPGKPGVSVQILPKKIAGFEDVYRKAMAATEYTERNAINEYNLLTDARFSGIALELLQTTETKGIWKKSKLTSNRIQDPLARKALR